MGRGILADTSHRRRISGRDAGPTVHHTESTEKAKGRQRITRTPSVPAGRRGRRGRRGGGIVERKCWTIQEECG